MVWTAQTTCNLRPHLQNVHTHRFDLEVLKYPPTFIFLAKVVDVKECLTSHQDLSSYTHFSLWQKVAVQQVKDLDVDWCSLIYSLFFILLACSQSLQWMKPVTALLPDKLLTDKWTIMCRHWPYIKIIRLSNYCSFVLYRLNIFALPFCFINVFCHDVYTEYQDWCINEHVNNDFRGFHI